MGKVSVASTKQKQHHNPLYKDVTSDGGRLRNKSSKKDKSHQEETEDFVDAATSRKILQLAREQQEEVEAEENATNKQSNITTKYRFQVPQDSDEEDESENDEDEEEYTAFEEYDEDFQEAEVDEEDEINEEDAKLFEQYLNSTDPNRFNGNQSYNLADKIMAEIENKKAQLEAQQTANGDVAANNNREGGVMLPPKVIAAYTQIGQVLSTWTHGKLPKLFKIIPSLNNWEDVLYVTDPSSWSPNAVYEATRLFVSNLGSREAEKFINMVLLDRFRDDIEQDESHKLNYHIYRALKKSLYKPSAFFKGFLFPLVELGCNNNEAKIAGSILTRVSIPVLHSSVALSHLLSLDYSPAITLFIRVLIEKKYALPYQTIDDLVFYFMKFRVMQTGDRMDEDGLEEETRDRTKGLTLVWYKAFLSFAQRYKNDITDDQRDFLLETIRQRFHKGLGPEIRRELLAGKPRMSEGIKETEPEMIDIF